MKKIISKIFFIFFATSVFSAEPLVDVSWLNKNLNNKKIFILDIRNKIDNGSYETFKLAHIPGSVHSDYLKGGWRAEIKGVVGQYPGTKHLEQLIGGLGIDNSKHVVIVYGGANSTDFGSAARIYWTFKTLGHQEVSILNGGLNAWQKAGLKTEAGENKITPSKFVAKFDKKYLADYKEVRDARRDRNGYTLIDARPVEFFKGEKKFATIERAGTIPTAKNLQESALIDTNSSIKSADEIKQLVKAADLKAKKGFVTFCNTGHWAATVWFGLSEIAKVPNVKMYDGSMAHWTINPKNEVIKG
jgi:thiosulfate/3-mercaptopyruvate sulfurtransferase